MENSFMYTISSSDRTNIAANQIYYDINFGGFSSPHESYKIKVVNCVISGAVNEDNGYLILICEGLNNNGVFCPKVLNSNDSIICTIPVNYDVLMSSGGIEFTANSIRIAKTIRFSLLTSSFDPVVSGVDININVETQWILTLKITPVE